MADKKTSAYFKEAGMRAGEQVVTTLLTDLVLKGANKIGEGLHEHSTAD